MKKADAAPAATKKIASLMKEAAWVARLSISLS